MAVCTELPQIILFTVFCLFLFIQSSSGIKLGLFTGDYKDDGHHVLINGISNNPPGYINKYPAMKTPSHIPSPGIREQSQRLTKRSLPLIPPRLPLIPPLLPLLLRPPPLLPRPIPFLPPPLPLPLLPRPFPLLPRPFPLLPRPLPLLPRALPLLPPPIIPPILPFIPHHPLLPPVLPPVIPRTLLLPTISKSLLKSPSLLERIPTPPSVTLLGRKTPFQKTLTSELTPLKMAINARKNKIKRDRNVLEKLLDLKKCGSLTTSEFSRFKRLLLK